MPAYRYISIMSHPVFYLKGGVTCTDTQTDNGCEEFQILIRVEARENVSCDFCKEVLTQNHSSCFSANIFSRYTVFL